MKKRKQRRQEARSAAAPTATAEGMEKAPAASAGDVTAVDAITEPGAIDRQGLESLGHVDSGREDAAAPETTTQDLEELADSLLFAAPAELTDDRDSAEAAPAAGLDAGANAEPTDDVNEELAAAPVGEEAADAEPLPEVAEASRLESIIESLLFAADRPLVVNELKRLLGEGDGKRIAEALDNLRVRHADSGIQLVSVAGGWQLRTHPGNGAWVAKLVAGRPTRLSRAMMETLAIVAYRQPITRPEIDEIRGVDCGPVLRTLLDRALIRVIGKKEEVGRPILYGTTPEFLKIFSLRDLADLPTLREFHELGADDRAKVDATAPATGAAEGIPGFAPDAAAGMSGVGVSPGERPLPGGLPDVDAQEEDSLIEALEEATHAAGRATRSLTDPESTEQLPADGASTAPASASSSSSPDAQSSGER